MGRELIALLRSIVLLCSIVLAGCGGPRAVTAPPIEPGPRAAPTGPTSTDSAGARAARVRVRVLRVLVTDARDSAQARERATMLARTARADDFSELAARYGDGDEPRRSELASAGLEITADAPAIVPAQVRDAARALALHEVSRPIEGDDGLWVLQRIE